MRIEGNLSEERNDAISNHFLFFLCLLRPIPAITRTPVISLSRTTGLT